MKTKERDVPPSNYQGSQKTYTSVKNQIEARLGSKAAELYDPYSNCLTYREWMKRGFVVNKGEKCFKSVVLVEKRDKKNKIIATYPKQIALFFVSQVKKVEN